MLVRPLFGFPDPCLFEHSCKCVPFLCPGHHTTQGQIADYFSGSALLQTVIFVQEPSQEGAYFIGIDLALPPGR